MYGVVRADMYVDMCASEPSVHVNQRLVEAGFADKCEESHVSQVCEKCEEVRFSQKS